jgi:hypothetical protein
MTIAYSDFFDQGGPEWYQASVLYYNWSVGSVLRSKQGRSIDNIGMYLARLKPSVEKL